MDYLVDDTGYLCDEAGMIMVLLIYFEVMMGVQHPLLILVEEVMHLQLINS